MSTGVRRRVDIVKVTRGFAWHSSLSLRAVAIVGLTEGVEGKSASRCGVGDEGGEVDVAGRGLRPRRYLRRPAP